ncbi:hypothetical protein Sjap_005145 [Stephania japonica]|uniref:Uncharacterized protein n=1 Tax=Stephania japonica TaxID=461633 RepID=A0AAP0K3I7_9MAGN
MLDQVLTTKTPLRLLMSTNNSSNKFFKWFKASNLIWNHKFERKSSFASSSEIEGFSPTKLNK